MAQRLTFTGDRICPSCEGLIQKNSFWLHHYPHGYEQRVVRFCSKGCLRWSITERMRKRETKSNRSGYYDSYEQRYVSGDEINSKVAEEMIAENAVHVSNGIPIHAGTGEVIQNLGHYNAITDRIRKIRSEQLAKELQEMRERRERRERGLDNDC